MELSFRTHTLEFKRPFKIAHGVRSTTPIVLTELTHDGIKGYGEGSMPPYLGENHETVSAFLKMAQPLLASFNSPYDMETILKKVDQLSSGNTAAKASIDIALHDLVGKLLNKPCYALWNLDKNATPFTTYTIGIDVPEIIHEKVKEGDEYKIFKVKLDGSNDKEMINTIREVSNKPIAVDVNQGWKDKDQALEMIHWLKDKNVLFVEQPMPVKAYDDMRWLKTESPLPLIADESCQRLNDIEKIKDGFHGINIKLMKCTGMHEAYKMILCARELKLKILIGCMSETYCAVSAAAQLTPLADWADLDGPLLIKDRLFSGIKFIDGKITLNDLPGIGVESVM